MQIVERSRRLLYLYTANVTESWRATFFLTLVYKELLETSLSLHFSTISKLWMIESAFMNISVFTKFDEIMIKLFYFFYYD